ncbi:MAG: HD-GYP domain-containing protein [Desulfovibrio sp.]
MAAAKVPEYRIKVEQIKPGVFIRIEKANWFDHPFLFNNFKVKDEKQIAVLRSLNFEYVICVPEKSDALPLTLQEAVKQPPATEIIVEEALDELWDAKNERTTRLREKKERLAQCERYYVSSLKTLASLERLMRSGSSVGVNDTLAFIRRLANYFLSDRESTLHLMNVMPDTDREYSHSLNVCVLSLMVGKDAGLNEKEMIHLGMGALFHDIGKSRIDVKVLKKRGALTRPEQGLIERHPVYGVDLLSSMELFPDEAMPIVAQHHERMDGSGYPQGLAGDKIDRMARIVAIADAYDSLCNHHDPDQALTPYLTLSYLFGQQKKKFDIEMLTLFIRCLGVYPPGTVVQLSNGAIGMVMSVSAKHQLQPSVVIYDANVPKKEALIVDLKDEPDIKVEKSLRLSKLEPEVFEYLNPRTRISYYVGG